VRVERLGLTPATLERLHQAGIVNVKQLTSRSTVELMQRPDIGPAVIYEAMRQLSKPRSTNSLGLEPRPQPAHT